MASASDKAEELFLSGHTCSQAVVLSLCERLGLPSALACRASLGLGGGVGRLREVCGAVSAMAVLAGLRHGADTADADAKKRTYHAVQDMAAEFKAGQGTMLCREVLGLAPGDTGGDPEPRTPAYYERRKKCLACVRLAADIAERHLLPPEIP